MIEGHPFETEALDNLRSRTRRALRQINPVFIKQAVRQSPGKREDVDTPELVEWELRRFAESAIDRCESHLHRELGDAESARLISRFIRRTARHALPTPLDQWNREQGSAAEISIPNDHPEFAELLSAALALVWADDLALDAYVDSRVSESRNRLEKLT